MREVRAGALQGMSSPIRHVMAHIHEAMVNIAPERRAEFARDHAELVLEYVDDHRWICHVDVANRHVTIGRKVMEVLWAASLAYFRLYLEIQRRTGGNASISVQFELAEVPLLKEAVDLLRWAMDSWLNSLPVPWPSNLPQPVPNPQHASDLHVADELSLCAIAFIVHHELAHVRLNHVGKSELDSERDADRAASEWILGGLADEADKEFVKRALGVAVALEALVARGIHTGVYGGTSHPRSFDRMMNTFDQHVTDGDHPVWFFLSAILKLHLDNALHGATIPVRPFDSARECVDSYVDALSRIDSQ